MYNLITNCEWDLFLTFHLHSVHCSWLVNNPENGWKLFDRDGMLFDGIWHNELHGLWLSPLQSPFPISPLIPGIISVDLAIMMPGFMLEAVATFVMDWVWLTAWLLWPTPLCPFSLGSSWYLLFEEMSLQETLLSTPGSQPEPLISVTNCGTLSRASDKQPFCW